MTPRSLASALVINPTPPVASSAVFRDLSQELQEALLTATRPPTPENHPASRVLGEDLVHPWWKQLAAGLLTNLPLFKPRHHTDPLFATLFACPDLLLLEGDLDTCVLPLLPTLIPELQAHGERTLILAPDAAMADQITRVLQPACEVLRALAPEESVADDLRTICSRTHGPEQVVTLQSALRDSIHELNESLKQGEKLTKQWLLLEEKAVQRAAWERESQHLQEELLAIPAQVRQEADTPDSPLGKELAHLLELVEEPERIRMQQRLDQLQAAFRETAERLEAKKTGQMGLFRSLFAGDLQGKAQELEEQVAKLQENLKAFDSEQQKLREQRREEQILVRIAEQEQILSKKLEALDSQKQRIDQESASIHEELAVMGLTLPSDGSLESIQAARMAAEQICRTAGEKKASAQKSLAQIEADVVAAATRLLARWKVVVAPALALTDLAITAAPFDRVMVVHAERFPEEIWMKSTTLAPRWVFTGHPPQQSGLLSQAWEQLATHAWRRESDHLICRLESFPGQTLICEPLIDRPEIELRFGFRAGDEPAVAEVAFPESFSITEAVALLGRELEEVRPIVWGYAAWSDLPNARQIQWTKKDLAESDWLPAGPGLQQQVIRVNGLPRTIALRFDLSQGWTSESAEKWCETHASARRHIPVTLDR